MCTLYNHLNYIPDQSTMAKPIKETPVLKGSDAQRFVKEIAASPEIKQEKVVKMREHFNLFRQK